MQPPSEEELALREGRRRAHEVLVEMVGSEEEEYVLNLHYLVGAFVEPLDLHEKSVSLKRTQAASISWLGKMVGGKAAGGKGSSRKGDSGYSTGYAAGGVGGRRGWRRRQR